MGPGKTTLTFDEVKKIVSDKDLASHYLGISRIPCVIHSPIRTDNNPSFAIYMSKNNEVKYKDFATGENGSIYTLLCQMWHCSFREMMTRIIKDVKKHPELQINHYNKQPGKVTVNNSVSLQCKIREWKKYDIDYWQSYGIPLKWLKYADVYPISHKIIIKDDKKYVFGADKYAYAYVERKEGKVTLKIYQPYNKNGFKWTSKHDRSVISLWTKLPANGEKVVICSSLKDALCLWANTGIPAIAVQGEGYGISDTAINNLRERFRNIYILFDNDDTGISDGIKLSEKTGFTYIVPDLKGQKDFSDYYKSLENKEEFKQLETLFY